MSQICYRWGDAGVEWKAADWPWVQCQGAIDCAKWGTSGVKWIDADWYWNACGGRPPPSDCAVWGTTPFLWKDAAWWWIQCGNVGPTPPTPPTASVTPPWFQWLGADAVVVANPQPWIIEPWNPYIRLKDSASLAKRRKKIKLICKVRGVTFEQEKEAEVKENLLVEDVRVEIGTFSNIGLDVRLE